jgi:hypothetical protein
MERTSRRKNFLRKIPAHAALWIGWSAFPIILAGVVLMELGFPSWLGGDAAVYLLVVAAILFALFQTMLDQHQDLAVHMSAQSNALGSLNQLMGEGEALLKVEAAILEIEERLRGANTRASVTIEHFGLDMSVAWNSVEALIRRLTFVTELEYRILILSGERGGKNLPRDVQDWIRLGRTKLDAIVERAAQLEKLFAREGRQLTCSVREYCDLPVIHGIRIVSPVQIAFISFCRWGEEGYEWGSDDYRRIAATRCSEAQRDILEIFDGNFAHYWNLAESAALAPRAS